MIYKAKVKVNVVSDGWKRVGQAVMKSRGISDVGVKHWREMVINIYKKV